MHRAVVPAVAAAKTLVPGAICPTLTGVRVQTLIGSSMLNCGKILAIAALVALTGSGLFAEESLTEARKGFETKLARTQQHTEPLDPPPNDFFSLVKYESPIGKMSAYVSRPEDTKKKHAAIVWLTGGFPAGGIGASAWEPVSSDNDQSAKAYRYAGLVMMYPTLRGSFGNPGKQETFYGEVDDVIAAAKYLKTVDYVDPDRIYLGGHSTGGTLALLVAESTDLFRAVISFGPTDDPSRYGPDSLTYNPLIRKENRLRSPALYLESISTPTFVIEGSVEGNTEALEIMREKTQNPKLHFYTIEGADHFNVLAPLNHHIGEKIAKLGQDNTLQLTGTELQDAYENWQVAMREARDLRVLSSIRGSGTDLTVTRTARFYLIGWEKDACEKASKEAVAVGFTADPVEAFTNNEGRKYHVLVLKKTLVLRDLDQVFGASRTVMVLGKKHELYYDDWDAE